MIDQSPYRAKWCAPNVGDGLSALWIAAMLVASACPAQVADRPPRTVEVAIKPGAPWKRYPVRTLDDLPAAVRSSRDGALSPYGGWLKHQLPASGFFYVRINCGRWWLVDPRGLPVPQAGVASVKTIPTAGRAAALNKKFGSRPVGRRQRRRCCATNGFNGLGGWADADNFAPSPIHCPTPASGTS